MEMQAGFFIEKISAEISGGIFRASELLKML
jgi:hypothetical protein